MISRNGLQDIFSDLAQAGQGIIDAGAEAVGIEKGGMIDKAATTAADLAKKAGVIPGSSSGNGYIDNKTMDTAAKILNGNKTATGQPGTTGPIETLPVGPIKTPDVSTIRRSNNTGVSVPTTIAPANGILEKINPMWTGAGVGGIVFLITRKLGRSAIVGTGAMLAHQAYKFNRS